MNFPKKSSIGLNCSILPQTFASLYLEIALRNKRDNREQKKWNFPQNFIYGQNGKCLPGCAPKLWSHCLIKYSKDLDWWEFKVIVTIVWTSLSSCTHLFLVILLFSGFLSPPGNGKTRSLDNFYLFFNKVIPPEITPSKCKVHRKKF